MLRDTGEQQLSHGPEELVIESVRFVSRLMIVGIAKLRRVGPHGGGDLALPEGGMIAAQQHREKSFQAEGDMESDDRKLRDIGARSAKDAVEDAGRVS